MDVGSINNNNHVRIDHPQIKNPSLYKEKIQEEPKAESKPDLSDKKALVEQMEQLLQDCEVNNAMRVTYDAELDRIVVQVLDGDTCVVEKQVPSEDFVAFAKKFKKALGALIERSV